VRSRRNKAYWEAAESEMNVVVFFSSSVPTMSVSYEQKKQV